MIVSNKYTKIERNGMYYIIPSSAPECPHCGGAMTVRDSKRRKLILSDGTVQMFVLRRYNARYADASTCIFLILCSRISTMRGRRSSRR